MRLEDFPATPLGDDDRGDGVKACAESVGTFDDDARRRLRLALNDLGPHDGENRTGRACWLIFIDFGRSVEEGWPLLQEWNARRHDPHSERELRRRMARALDHKATQRRGDAVWSVTFKKKTKAETTTKPDRPAEPGRLVMVCMADVVARPMQWLWYGRIGLGEMTLFDGDGGVGKGMTYIDLVARITTGRAMPFEMLGRAPASVVLLTSEEDLETTTKPRLVASRADSSRVHILQALRLDDGSKEMPCIPAHLPELRQAIEQTGALFVVIDPLTAYLDEEVNENSNAAIRRQVMDPLVGLARDKQIAVLGVRHVRKQGGTSSQKGQGASSFRNAARSVLYFGEDPDDEDARLIAVGKQNNTRKVPTLRYRIVEDDESGAGKIEWLGESARTADEVAGGAPIATKTDGCERWLASFLADGRRTWSDVRTTASAHSYSEPVVRAAGRRLGVKPAREGKGKDHVSWWELPKKEGDR